MSYHFQPFLCPFLSNYEVSTCGWDYPEQICGYDQQGHSWGGEELLAMREQGLIIKECPEKIVVVGEKGSLLGYIRECFDSTWLAHSCYFFGDIEISGFKDEFYAVRYLHQVMDATFPDMYEPVPDPPWQHENLVQERHKKAIFIEELNALIGYVKECCQGIWSADSCYLPKSMNGNVAVGFISEFYAVRYLYQIAEIAFRDIIENIPNLPWE